MTTNRQIFPRSFFLVAALLCTVVHAEEAASCKYFRLAELPLRYTGVGLQLTTDGTINHQTGPILIETGAEYSFMTSTGVFQRRLPITKSAAYAEGIGGRSALYTTNLDEFSIGSINAGKIVMMMIADTGAVPSYHAIAGAPFLLQTDMELSLAEKKLRFFSRKGCDDSSFLGYWGDDIFEIPFKRRAREGTNPHFTVEVNGQEMEAIIDSGAKVTSIMARAAKRAGLKLGAPGTQRLDDANGIGSNRVPRWSTLANLRIGATLAKNAEIDVLETDSLRDQDIDVILGDDFLRAHRVLFAMSQQKLYISYVGGLPFKHTALEPWLVQEAEAGNADAQMALSVSYSLGRGVEKDPAQAEAWLLKASANGSPEAHKVLALALSKMGRHDEAATHVRAMLDKNPTDRASALWLYVLRLRVGQADLGRRELEAAFAGIGKGEWPQPVADFFVGRIDQEAVFEAAASIQSLAKQRRCEASSFISAMYHARGDHQQANAMSTSLEQCAPPVQTASANPTREPQ
jgi:TPR repeat protein